MVHQSRTAAKNQRERRDALRRSASAPQPAVQISRKANQRQFRQRVKERERPNLGGVVHRAAAIRRNLVTKERAHCARRAVDRPRSGARTYPGGHLLPGGGTRDHDSADAADRGRRIRGAAVRAAPALDRLVGSRGRGGFFDLGGHPDTLACRSCAIRGSRCRGYIMLITFYFDLGSPYAYRGGDRPEGAVAHVVAVRAA